MYKIIQPDKETNYDEKISPAENVITIFLAGSIEMGKAAKWQEKIAQKIYDSLVKQKGDLEMPTLVFYNPRREQDFTPEMEKEQIDWEQFRLLQADYIFMYIQPDTKSPISLLEFGEFIDTGKLYACCTPEFYRYQNLAITAKYHDQVIYHTIEDAIKDLIDDIVYRLMTGY